MGAEESQDNEQSAKSSKEEGLERINGTWGGGGSVVLWRAAGIREQLLGLASQSEDGSSFQASKPQQAAATESKVRALLRSVLES